MVFRSRVSEVIGQRATKPHAHLRARACVQLCERRLRHLGERWYFHLFAYRSSNSLSKSATRQPAPLVNAPLSDAIITSMSDRLSALSAAHDRLIHITIPVGILQCNCSIIGDPVTREALVVDPGDEVTRILDLIGRHHLTVKAIVSTHAHIDHVGGLSKLHQYTGAPVLMHRDDLPLYQAMEMQASFLGVHPPELTDIDQLLKEGDVLRWGSFEAQVIHTPGHTPGSVSLYLPHDAGKVAGASTIHTVLDEAGEKIALTDLLKKIAGPEEVAEDLPPDEPEKTATHAPQLFSGDTLFAGSIGR